MGAPWSPPATTSQDETVRLWDPTTGTPVGNPLTGHYLAVTAAAAGPLPDGRTLLATTSYDETVRLWDPTTCLPVGNPLTGYRRVVNAAATVPLPDGRTLLTTTSADETVRLWDPTNCLPVGDPLTGHTGPVFAVATSMLDGHPIAVAGGDDATVRVRDLSAGGGVGYPLAVSGAVQAIAFDLDRAYHIVLAGDGVACVSIDLEAIR
jgi:WD40 repeat protein